MNKQFSDLVFIGRFQPFHNGHYEVLKKALGLAARVIVLFGSARRPRNVRDPWNVAERTVMVSACFEQAVAEGRLVFRAVVDRMYNDQQWAASVQAAVQSVMEESPSPDPDGKVGIIGHSKDRSSFYLRMFPQWELVDVPSVAGLSATEIRGYLLGSGGKSLDQGTAMLIASAVPSQVRAFLERFRETPYFAPLVDEYAFLRAYRSQFEQLKYPPIFVTTDAVVIQSGHVLLIKRRSQPGSGLWALPGGFLQSDERLVDGMLRELREETRLKVPEPVLRGGIRTREVFDHPDRSLRGRTITHAFLIELADGSLPPVKGSDDAARAIWVPIAQALELDEGFYEDHLDIIRFFLGRL